MDAFDTTPLASPFVNGADLTEDQVARFRADGFLIVDRLIAPDAIDGLRARFEPLFRGSFETGLYPDEWNWREGRDSPDLTRQICNGWKSDRTVAAVLLSETVGRLCATLGGWAGARLVQDNVLWKPPGARALGFHQDDSYVQWVDPPDYVTCWMALDDTSAAGGTVEYVRGSHRWPLSEAQPEYFHAPDDYRAPMRAAAAEAGIEPEIVPVEVPAGGCAFHAGGTWHGSGPNRADVPRRALVAHCVPSDARFHPTNVSYIYSRYKRAGSLDMDETFFPVLWSRGGHRSAFIDGYLAGRRPFPGADT